MTTRKWSLASLTNLSRHSVTKPFCELSQPRRAGFPRDQMTTFPVASVTHVWVLIYLYRSVIIARKSSSSLPSVSANCVLPYNNLRCVVVMLLSFVCYSLVFLLEDRTPGASSYVVKDLLPFSFSAYVQPNCPSLRFSGLHIRISSIDLALTLPSKLFCVLAFVAFGDPLCYPSCSAIKQANVDLVFLTDCIPYKF